MTSRYQQLVQDAERAGLLDGQNGHQPEITSPWKASRDDVLSVVRHWLWLEDVLALDILLAVCISNAMPGDPVWLFLIAPPGGTKTELLRAFQGPHVVSTSTLTPQTLISGLKGDPTKTDLMSRLDGKLLIIKDGTSILAKKPEDQAAIFSDLREAYDGYLEKSFGSGVGTKAYAARFTLLMGMTPAIDGYRTIHSLLGERFLRVGIQSNPELAIRKASEGAGHESEMREEMAQAFGGFLAQYSAEAPSYSDAPIPSDILEQIRAVGDITAKLRSGVARDRHHSVLYVSEPEIGTRLTKQLLKLCRAATCLYGHREASKDELALVHRVATDSIPRARMSLARALFNSKDFTTSRHLGDMATLPTSSATTHLEDMWVLGLVERKGEGTNFVWRANAETVDLLSRSGLDA